jgi:DNA-binding NarL/FixJ family response regulator
MVDQADDPLDTRRGDGQATPSMVVGLGASAGGAARRHGAGRIGAGQRHDDLPAMSHAQRGRHPGMKRIRVLLADDHETVRQGLKLLIDGQADMEVVGEAGDGKEAVQSVTTLRPEVAVIDISMPGMNGLEATRVIKARVPETAVVALTRYGDEAYVKEMFGVGARGYVLKQSASGELLAAIRAAAKGKQYVDTCLASRAAGAVFTSQLGTRPRITDRETEVLRFMALGHSNKEIAATLDVSVKTVEVHKTNAMRKLGLQGRIDVVRYAFLQGWLREP